MINQLTACPSRKERARDKDAHLSGGEKLSIVHSGMRCEMILILVGAIGNVLWLYMK